MTDHVIATTDRTVGGSSGGPARPVAPSRGMRRGADLHEVQLARDGFWGSRQELNASATLDHCLSWMERLGWVGNFDSVAAGTTGGYRPGWQFSDSEVYKLIEALAWEHGRTAAPHVEQMLTALVDRVGAAQDADGYLNTCFGHRGQSPRWSDLESGHELYCVGHLLQAAVARVRTRPDGGHDDRLVEIARRAADDVCTEFGADGREAICGHPEIELGLVELGRALSEPRYVEQARLFVERRGRGLLGPIPLLGPAYFQDDVPVREARAWRGHAVRALYLSAAAVDVGVDLDDGDLVDAVRRQWAHSVARRTYITGGMGSRHQDEGFGDDWELPPDRAYCETCAGIASTMVSWRLYLATGDARYVDLMERTFYNVLATSTGDDGASFFYANTLHQRAAGADVPPGQVNPRAEGGTRAPWFDVSCCPTNVARTLAVWHTYAVSVSRDGSGNDVVDLLQFAAGRYQLALVGGDRLELRVDTDYPHRGTVTVEVLAAPRHAVTLRLRIPHWAEGARLDDGLGRHVAVTPGWAVVRRPLRPGERMTLHLPMEPRLTFPDPRIDAVRGCVAVERGPLVLCLESVDLPEGVELDDVRIDVRSGPSAAEGGAAVHAVARKVAPVAEGPEEDGLSGTYRSVPAVPAPSEAFSLRLVPYFGWARRRGSAMRVFLPTL